MYTEHTVGGVVNVTGLYGYDEIETETEQYSAHPTGNGRYVKYNDWRRTYQPFGADGAVVQDQVVTEEKHTEWNEDGNETLEKDMTFWTEAGMALKRGYRETYSCDEDLAGEAHKWWVVYDENPIQKERLYWTASRFEEIPEDVEELTGDEFFEEYLDDTLDEILDEVEYEN
jgi:hypothetical protein